MPFFDHIGNRKIIILSTTTDGWTKEEIAVNNLCNRQAKADITRAGFKCQIIEISTAKDMVKKLRKINPNKVVIVNWIEEIEGLKYGYHIAPEILDKLGFIYTGNNSDTLLDSFDKIKTKSQLKKNGVSTPNYIVLDQDNLQLGNWNTYPCIIKPVNEHCSYGITANSVVDNRRQLLSRAKSMFARFKQPLLVEEFIEGVEFFVSSWGYGLPVLPPVYQDYSYTSDYHHQIYDYVAKWNSRSKAFKACSHRLLSKNRAIIPPDLYTQVSLATQAVGCTSYSRVDVRVRDGIPYVLDINPNPDIVVDSDFSLAAAQIGYNFGQTILKLCDLAVKNSFQPALENEKLSLPSPAISPAFAAVTA